MSLVTDLPAIFDQFSEARQTGFLTVMDLKGAAFRWLALTAFMPARNRWRPVRLWFRSVPPLVETIEGAEKICRATSAR